MLKIPWADDKALEHFKNVKVYLLDKIRKVITGNPVTLYGQTYQLEKGDTKGHEIFNLFSNEDGLKELIIGRPDKLREIIFRINQIDNSIFSSNSNINRLFYNIFIVNTYDGIKKVKKVKINRFDKFYFIEKIEIDTCPYCNRSYIYTIEKNISQGIKVKPQIDHFFPKSDYPFLGMSYYNLIPSCTLCNGFDNKDTKSPISDNSNPHGSILIFNPYEIELEIFKYSYDIINTNYFKKESFKVNLDFPDEYKDNYESFFGLATLYEQHNDHVQDLLIKKQKYNEVSRIFINNSIDGEGATNIPEEKIDFERLYYGYYSNENEFHRRPLSKFFNDIVNQTEIK